MINKEHLIIEGIQKIVNIRASINLGGSESLKEAFPSQSQLWLGEAVQLKFELAQHSPPVGRDSKLLTSLQNLLGYGSVNKHYPNAVTFSTTKFSDIMECLIPFFDKYKIIGVKSKDYPDFKKVAQLMEKKAHLTIEGQMLFVELKLK